MTPTTQAFVSSTEAMMTLTQKRLESIKNAAEALRQDARTFQADLDLRSKWIKSLMEKYGEDENARALLDECQSFTNLVEGVNNVINEYDEWLGRLEKF